MLALYLAVAALVVDAVRAERLEGDSLVEQAERLEGDSLVEQAAIGESLVGPFTQQDALKHVINPNFKPEFLGVGGFGQAWRVEDLSGRKVVLKLVHKEGQLSKLVYRRDLKDERLLDRIWEAALECETARKLAKGSDNPAYTGHGEVRIMRCYTHNFGTKSETEPLYMLLEDAGTLSLSEFRKKLDTSHMWTPELVRQLTKQLLEGFEYLQGFRHSWIHHDMKPENIVVKENPGKGGGGDFYTLKLIDFGATIHDSPQEWCEWRTGSPPYRAPEYEHQTGDDSCPLLSYDPKYPKAFDMFSVGGVILNMLTGAHPDRLASMMKTRDKVYQNPPVTLSPTKYLGCNEKFRTMHHLMRVAFERPNAAEEVLTMYKEQRYGASSASKAMCKQVLEDPAALSFFEKLFATLRANPEERPTAHDLLEEPWMAEVETIGDPDYFQELPDYAKKPLPRPPGSQKEVLSAPQQPLPRAPPPTAATSDVEMVDVDREEPPKADVPHQAPEANAQPQAVVPQQAAPQQESWLASLKSRLPAWQSWLPSWPVLGGQTPPEAPRVAEMQRPQEAARPATPPKLGLKRARASEDAAPAKVRMVAGAAGPVAKAAGSADSSDVEMSGTPMIMGRRPIKKARRKKSP